jgi:hypothetical protein
MIVKMIKKLNGNEGDANPPLSAGLVDEQQKVRTITALALAALAEAATPYGIESFDSVLKPLWKGIRTHRGKGLAAFLKVRCAWQHLNMLAAVLNITIKISLPTGRGYRIYCS